MEMYQCNAFKMQHAHSVGSQTLQHCVQNVERWPSFGLPPCPPLNPIATEIGTRGRRPCRGEIFGPDKSGNCFLFTGSGYLFRTVDAETVTAFANFVFLVVVSFPCSFDLLFANLYVYMPTSMPLLFRR
jgi:hypothetical protein